MSSEHATTPSEAVTLASAPVVAHTTRSGFVESVHHALVTVTSADGEVVAAWGSSDAVIFPRSSNKPLQALAMLRHGLELEDELLALVCSSHSGEAFHIEGVRRILAQYGLRESDLQNTPDLPYDELDRVAWTREGREAVSIAQNCSGKHAGMLATCVAAGWSTSDYRDPNHPLQVAMKDTLEEISDSPVDALGVDGCGAPVMSLTMAGLARAFGRIANPQADIGVLREAADRIRTAIVAAPRYLGGTRRDVTALIEHGQGLVAKDGAEAVYAIGLPDGRGIAVKIADGSQRARPVVAAAVLREIGYETEALQTLENAPIKGHGVPVGAVTAALGEPSFSVQGWRGGAQ